MATVNLGRIKPVFRGAYSGSTAYVVDDIVTSSGSSYICIQAHGAGTQAVTVTAYWTQMSAIGGNPQLSMTWDNATADADNGAGKIAWNHATIASATILYVDDADDGSANIQPYVDTWDAVTNTTAKGVVTITKEGTPSTFATFKVTGAVVDATGYSKIPVTHLVSNGTFSDGDGVGVNFNYSGLDGTDVSTTLTTQGDILYRDGSGLQRLAKPASSKLLQMTSAGVPSWVTIDLSEIEQDVMILGLHTATARNSSETDLSSSHIIRFEDDTQIATETTGDRNATSECWSSVASTETSIPVKLLVTGGTTSSSSLTDTSASPMSIGTTGSPTWTTAAYKYGTNSMLLNGSSQYIKISDHSNFDYDNDNNGFTFEMWWKQVSTSGEDGYGNMPLYGQCGTSSNGNPRNVVWRRDTDTITHYHQAATPDGTGDADVSGATMEDGNWHHIATVFEHNSGNGKLNHAVDGVWTDNPASTYTPGGTANEFKIGRAQSSSGSAGYANMYVDSFRLTHQSLYTIGSNFTPPTTAFGTTHTFITDNAAGTLITTAQTVGSAKTSCSGILMYKDAVGTNTLGTDLKIYFSADNGSNFTEAASYTALTPTFNSAGVKMVKLGATTVTSGTQIKVKAVFANQAVASKYAEIYGLGVNY